MLGGWIPTDSSASRIGLRATETDFTLLDTGDTMFVTLFPAKKGEPPNNLSAWDADGRRLTILSRKDSMAVPFWSAVRSLVKQSLSAVQFTGEAFDVLAHAELARRL